MNGYHVGANPVNSAAFHENMKHAQRSMVDQLAPPSLSGSYANLQQEVALLADLVSRLETMASAIDGAPSGVSPNTVPPTAEPRSALERFAQAVSDLASLRGRLEEAQQRIVMAL